MQINWLISIWHKLSLQIVHKQRFLQSDIIILDVCGQELPKSPTTKILLFYNGNLIILYTFHYIKTHWC